MEVTLNCKNHECEHVCCKITCRSHVAWPQKLCSINLKIQHSESCSNYALFSLTIAKMSCSYSSSERSGLVRRSRNTCSLWLLRLFRASGAATAAVSSVPPSSPTAVCAHQRAAAGRGRGAAKLWHVYCGSCQGRYQQQMSRVGQHHYLLTSHVVDMNI